MNPAPKTIHKHRILFQKLLPIHSPRPGCPCGLEFNSRNWVEGTGYRRGRDSSCAISRWGVMLCLGIRLSCFLLPDNPGDRPPGRGHQSHHPRGEPGPGVPGHRLPRQGGGCGVQPSGGWLHPCRTVSGGLRDVGRAGMRSPRKKMTDADVFPGQQQRLLELMHKKGDCPSPSRVCVGGTPTTPQLLN